MLYDILLIREKFEPLRVLVVPDNLEEIDWDFWYVRNGWRSALGPEYGAKEVLAGQGLNLGPKIHEK